MFYRVNQISAGTCGPWRASPWPGSSPHASRTGFRANGFYSSTCRTARRAVRRRHTSWSNFTRPSRGRCLERRGMTALMPDRHRYARVRRWLSPVSPAASAGPPPAPASGAYRRTCPAEGSVAGGTLCPALTRRSLVGNPPRLRPRAWSAAGHRPTGPDGGVHATQVPVDPGPLVPTQLQPRQWGVDGAVRSTAGDSVVHRHPHRSTARAISATAPRLAPLTGDSGGGAVVVPRPPLDRRKVRDKGTPLATQLVAP